MSDSRVSAFGAPPPRTWNDYEEGCMATYGGGYQTEAERKIFRHGMATVFNLLRAEFPPAEKICNQAPAVDARSGRGMNIAAKLGQRDNLTGDDSVEIFVDGEEWREASFSTTPKVAAEVARRINHAEQLAEQLEYDADSFRGELHDLEHGTLGEFGISILRYRLKRIDAALAAYRAKEMPNENG